MCSFPSQWAIQRVLRHCMWLVLFYHPVSFYHSQSSVSCGRQGPVRQLAMLIFLMLLVIFLVHPCCMLLHKTNIWTLQFMWLLWSVLPIHCPGLKSTVYYILCMWHCSTTAYPACHEDRGERNSLFDSGPSGRLWHVAPKIHHWTIPRPISHRTLGLCMGFSETSQHMFL